MFPQPIKPMLYPTPAFVADSVRRLLEEGGVKPASTVCGADALRGDGLGAVMVWRAMLGEADGSAAVVAAAVVGVCGARVVVGVAAGDDIFFSACSMTSPR